MGLGKLNIHVKLYIHVELNIHVIVGIRRLSILLLVLEISIRSIRQKHEFVLDSSLEAPFSFLIDAQRDHRGFVGVLNKWRALHKRFYCTHFTIVHTLSINYIHDYKQKILNGIWKKNIWRNIKARPLRDLKKSSKGFGKINYLTKN